jgi:GDPmannose 4,6-dehydratase
MKRALVTGVTGQDGSYLAKHLIDKGYQVCGIVRNHTQSNQLQRLRWIFSGDLPQELNLEYSDLTDAPSLNRIIQSFQPDEVYNLAAQSHVGISFMSPVSTATINALGVMNVLEACRAASTKPKFYQASTSEMFGKVQEIPQNEKTSFYPRSPYGVAKLFGYWLTINYRESYDLFSANGILFNHESPIRGDNFVTKKITKGLVSILRGKQPVLELGNLEARRDWGHAKDYVRAMHLILQHPTPEDFVIATGIQHSVREFCEIAAEHLELGLEWQGDGIDEIGYSTKLNKVVIKINPTYYRPTEIDTLLGDNTKAHAVLGWKPTIPFENIVKEMLAYDLETV